MLQMQVFIYSRGGRLGCGAVYFKENCSLVSLSAQQYVAAKAEKLTYFRVRPRGDEHRNHSIVDCCEHGLGGCAGASSGKLLAMVEKKGGGRMEITFPVKKRSSRVPSYHHTIHYLQDGAVGSSPMYYQCIPAISSVLEKGTGYEFGSEGPVQDLIGAVYISTTAVGRRK